MKLIKSCVILAALTLLAGCASQSLLDKYRDQSDEQIFTGGEKKLADGDWTQASEHFEALQALYPFGPYAQQGELDSIYSYYADADYGSAEAEAERYIHLYPMGPNTDYALYMKGLSEFMETIGYFQKHFSIDRSNRDLASYEKAFADFAQLIQNYPNSIYAADAHKRLVYIRNLFAEHYFNTGAYYYSRQAYVASAEQASIVVTDFQRTIWVPDALILMVRSYQKLGLTQQANDALSVLKLNYPDRVADLSKKQ